MQIPFLLVYAPYITCIYFHKSEMFNCGKHTLDLSNFITTTASTVTVNEYVEPLAKKKKKGGGGFWEILQVLINKKTNYVYL